MGLDELVELNRVTSLVAVDVGSEIAVLRVDSGIHVEDSSGVGEGDGLSVEGRTESWVLESSDSVLKVHDGLVVDDPAPSTLEVLNKVDTGGSHDEGTIVGDGLRWSGR